MPNTKLEWQRSDRGVGFDQLSFLDFPLIASVAASTVNTTVLGIIPLPFCCKVVKVAASFTAVTALTGTHLFNVAFNSNPVPTTGGAEGAAAAADNSYTGGTSTTVGAVTGTGVCTNPAVDGNVLFAADVALNTTNFPGATVGGGGVFGNFVPTNFDAFYPTTPFVNTLTGVAVGTGYFTLRAVVPAASSITNFQVVLGVLPVTPRAEWQTPGNPQNACIPGVAY